MYLPGKIQEKTDFYIETKRGNIPQHKQNRIKDFINKHHDLIMTRVKKWSNFVDTVFPKVFCQERKYDRQKILYTKDFEKDKKKIIKWLETKKKLLGEETVLIFNEKFLSEKDIKHIADNKKDVGLEIKAKNLLVDNEDDGIIVGINYENIYTCIFNPNSSVDIKPNKPLNNEY